MTNSVIYKIATKSQWDAARQENCFKGAPVDLQDGYIHFSTAEQVRETATKHFTGQSDLLLLAINTQALGHALRFEPSRGGDLFPHLYGTMPLHAVTEIFDLPLSSDGSHQFPEIIPIKADNQ